MNPSPTPPPNHTPGRTPNGGLAPPLRRRPADPLVRPKKSRPRPSGVQGVSQQTNGVALAKSTLSVNSATAARAGTSSPAPAAPPTAPTSSTPNGPYEDIPLFTTKSALLLGLRHHVMRFSVASSSKAVDPTDESQFTRPVRLHRRDPRANPLGFWKEGGPDAKDSDADDAIDEKERERLRIQREERRVEREAAQAQIAPVGKEKAVKKKEYFQKKTEQVRQRADTAEQKKANALHYEETLPWHLEDFDNKNTWAGTYEAALSDSHVMMIPDVSAGPEAKVSSYRLVPLEKWYRFALKNRFEALSIEEAEARMTKKIRDSRWFMDTQKVNEQKMKEEPRSTLFTRKGERGERIGVKAEDGDDDRPEFVADADDIDYNYDEAFADDEENPLFGGDDEENKEAEEKIKREQREANIFQLKEEKDYDREENEKKLKAKEEKKKAKRIQRALMKRERNYIYEDDSDGNPYSSESESEDSETERLREEEARKEEAQKLQDKSKLTTGEKIPSGASSRGTNTPSGRPKHSEPSRKGILKRPGSPNLSEASGNESSRKKHKKGSLPTSAPSDSVPNSRPSSPSRQSSIVRLNVDSSKLNSISSRPPQPSRHASLAGSGSDGEASAAEMSDGGRRLKLKMRAAAKNTSRAVSPAVGSGDLSRPSSPPIPKKAGPTPVTQEELAALIPAEGILMHTLVSNPRVRVTSALGEMLKAVSRFDKETKMLHPKNTPAEAPKA